MKHPEELLAEYVDGTLTPPVRSQVHAHLRSCEGCRFEVELAAEARRALASLPDAAVPAGLLDSVIVEAERNADASGPGVVPMRRVRAPGVPAWYRWAGVAGVAAAAVLVAVIALPNLRGRDAGVLATAESGDRAAGATSGGLEIQELDYDDSTILTLIGPYGVTGLPQQAETANDPTYAAAGDDPSVEPARTAEAAACLDTAFTSLDGDKLIQGERVRLISARFQGTPAYIGVYLVSPGAGEPADRVTVWVASSEDCSVLSATQATLTPSG